jgi:hypothetical protein
MSPLIEHSKVAYSLAPMWSNRIVCAALCVVAFGCGASGDDDDSADGTGGALGSGGTPVAMMGSGGVTGTGGMAAGTGGAKAAIMMCASGMCPPPSPLAAATMTETCCAPSGKCSSHMIGAADCKEPYMNTSKCPNPTIVGMPAQGCCLADMKTCGLYDSLTGSGCISLTMGPVAALGLKAATVDCDGNPVMMTTPDGGMMMMDGGLTGTGGMGAGTGGMHAGTGGMGTGGMHAGTGGM